MMAIRRKCVEMYFIKTTSDCFRMGFFLSLIGLPDGKRDRRKERGGGDSYLCP